MKLYQIRSQIRSQIQLYKNVRLLSKIAKLENIEYGYLINWRKYEGEIIKPDDVICTLETDKMCIDIRAENCGIARNAILKERLFPELCQTQSNSLDLFEYEHIDDLKVPTTDDPITQNEDKSLKRLHDLERNYERIVSDDVSKIALAYIEEGNPLKALEVIRSANNDSRNVKITRHLLSCIAHRQHGNLKEAKLEINEVEKLFVNTYCGVPWYAIHEKANVSMLEGDYETAKILWTKNYEKYFEPRWSSGYGLATIFMDEGNFEKSIDYCEKTLEDVKKHSSLIPIENVIKRRLEGLKAQLNEIRESPSRISIRKSNAPLITIVPDLNLDAPSPKITFSYQPRVYSTKEHFTSHDYDNIEEKACEILKRSKNLVAVTGSGISVASGLKTRQNLWQSQKWDRDNCVNVVGRYNDPKILWDLIKSFLEDANKKTLQPLPNIGHSVLAELEQKGILKAIITQNVDGLHQDAGSKNVIELHGSLMNKTKHNCKIDTPNTPDQQCKSCKDHLLQEDIICKLCNTYFIPDVVLFGEVVPKDKFDLAEKYIMNADTLFVIGTACDVAPTADLVVKYAQTGRPIIEVANEPSIITNRFNTNFILRPSELVLPYLAKKISEKQ